MQKYQDRLRGLRVGTLGLLLVLLLLAAGGNPTVHASDTPDPPPTFPHLFSGTVRSPQGVVPEGTVVQGFVDGKYGGEATVRAAGRYNLAVTGDHGDDGKTVTFRVGDAWASETATWASGMDTDNFDLTVPGGGAGPLPLPFDCFIATAAYGTESAVQIDILREFRDVVLMPNRAGAAFVSLYYQLSPPIAGVVARHEFLRTAVRAGFVDPIVAALNWSRGAWSGGSY